MKIETKPRELRLHGMCRSWLALLEMRRHHELNLADGLELLLQAEQEQRTGKRFEMLQKKAQFRYQASIEELKMESSRGMDRSVIAELATGTYIDKGEAILVSGAAGVGKSFLISALGH